MSPTLWYRWRRHRPKLSTVAQTLSLSLTPWKYLACAFPPRGMIIIIIRCSIAYGAPLASNNQYSYGNIYIIYIYICDEYAFLLHNNPNIHILLCRRRVMEIWTIAPMTGILNVRTFIWFVSPLMTGHLLSRDNFGLDAELCHWRHGIDLIGCWPHVSPACVNSYRPNSMIRVGQGLVHSVSG